MRCFFRATSFIQRETFFFDSDSTIIWRDVLCKARKKCLWTSQNLMKNIEKFKYEEISDTILFKKYAVGLLKFNIKNELIILQCPFCAYKAKQKMHIGRHLERMHKDIVKSDKYDEASASTTTNNQSSSSSTTIFPANLSLPSSITMTPMPSALNLTNVNTTI